MNALKKYWWLALIKGILLIILSFMVFRHPMDALVGVAIYIGITLILTALTEIAFAFATKDVAPKWGWGLAGGIIDLAFGFILLSNPALTAATIPFVVGFWIIICGISAFANSFSLKKEGDSGWWFGILIGVFSAIIGVFIINNLLAGVLTITSWMGLGFMLAGILNIGIGFKLKS